MFWSMILSLPGALALHAVITARQEPAFSENHRLIGYTYSAGKYTVWDCRESSAFITSGLFGRCAETAKERFIATACADTSVMVGDGTSSTCSGTKAQSICQTGTVYHHVGDQAPIMNYQCWPAWGDGSWQATMTTTVPESTSSTAAPSRTSSTAPQTASASGTPSSGASSSIASSPPQQTSPTAPPPQESKEDESKAWIAGAVIGPVIGIAIIGAGFFLYRRRQKKNAYNGAVELGTNNPKGADVYAYNASPNDTQNSWNNKPPISQNAPAELAAPTYAELDGGMAASEADGKTMSKTAVTGKS